MTVNRKQTMAGIYIHIPYCKTKCNYCDFYSIVNKQNENEFIAALLKEINLQKDFFRANTPIETIYFGGGTPSFIKSKNLIRILHRIYETFAVSDTAEITMEANPDDLDSKKLRFYQHSGFNRLSIGVQSILPEQLQFMQRRHTVKQSIDAVSNARKAGFENISVDLIYGLPKMSIQEWENSLDEVFKWSIQHISAYHLTVEEGTPLHKKLLKGEIKEIKDDLSFRQFESLMDKTAEAGFEQYEISNFTQKGLYSRHNTSYWQNEPYLGLGPAAHSYDLQSRYWNFRQLKNYIDKLNHGELAQDCEHLSILDHFNEQILTSLRTVKGISTESLFSLPEHKKELQAVLRNHLAKQNLEQKGDYIKLSRKGIHIADLIMSDLMIVEK